MLPSSLLITRRWRDSIRPVFADLSHKNIEVALLLIQTYKDYVGRKKGALNDALDGLEEVGYDYRYVRGLSALLNRRCQLESRATIDPVKVRRRVFKLAHEGTLPTTPESRRAVLYKAASGMGITVEELEESMYSDLENELILSSFKTIDPKTLIKQYNLSLTQTLLFYSTELTFTASGNWQHIFRQTKWLGLIYSIWVSDGTYKVRVDGPTSLFKLNRRYGTKLAKLLPQIIQSKGWSIKASILQKGRLLKLGLESKKHGGYLAVSKAPKVEVYDSQVEMDFAKRFKALDTGWKLIREPEPIPVGRQVMIPDFVFYKGGIRVYLEVVGFWTPNYLKDKIKKLSLLNNLDMIVAVDINLACQKLDRLGERLNVIYYKYKVPLRPVLTHLKNREKHLIKEQTRLIRKKTFTFQKPVVEARELAKSLKVLEEAVKNILREREFAGYIYLGDLLIKESKLKEIRDRFLERLEKGNLSFYEASKMIEEEGCKNPSRILEALGFKIEWWGIDPKAAKIRYKNKAQNR